MKKSAEQTLLEIFGDPLELVYGTKIGDVEGISDVGAVGVRGVSEDAVVCRVCGEMPIGGSCGCDHSSGEDEDTVCPGCGMMVVDGECGCSHDAVCPSCGQMPPEVDAGCSCGLMEGVNKQCMQCGMNEAMCECGSQMKETDLEEVAPEGYEDVVMALKKEPNVDNPWAIAWSMKNKGIKPEG